MVLKFVNPYVGTDASKTYTPDATYNILYICNMCPTNSLTFATTLLGTLTLRPGQSFSGAFTKGIGAVTITNASTCPFLVSTLSE